MCGGLGVGVVDVVLMVLVVDMCLGDGFVVGVVFDLVVVVV